MKKNNSFARGFFGNRYIWWNRHLAGAGAGLSLRLQTGLLERNSGEVELGMPA
jgi:hypothetical protein